MQFIHCEIFQLSAEIEPYYQKTGYANLHQQKLQLKKTLNDEDIEDEYIDLMEEYLESNNELESKN